MRPKPTPPAPGQESVWDYPRPPRLERVGKRIRILFNGRTIADTEKAWRVLETSHPPVYYLAPEDIRMEFLSSTGKRSFCEWKGSARYWTLEVDGKVAQNCAWSYPEPTEPFEPIRDHLAFYAEPMDECWVDDEKATPQPGGFYGGWVTSDVAGPFKGEPGSWGW